MTILSQFKTSRNGQPPPAASALRSSPAGAAAAVREHTVDGLRTRATELALEVVDAEGAGWFDFNFDPSPEVGRFDESTRVITPAVLSRMNARAFERFAPLANDAAPGPMEALTPRELEVGFWLSQGKTNQEIGLIISVAPRTAEKHVESILRKLHVENRTAAALVLHAHFSALPGARPGTTNT